MCLSCRVSSSGSSCRPIQNKKGGGLTPVSANASATHVTSTFMITKVLTLWGFRAIMFEEDWLGSRGIFSHAHITIIPTSVATSCLLIHLDIAPIDAVLGHHRCQRRLVFIGDLHRITSASWIRRPLYLHFHDYLGVNLVGI
jgi:hypothetical protein